ncbi:conjugative transposon protein TraM [Pedobacter polaris]|uniref:Conjugative transposon protein TraM n=1 Tax=Pedobacter polaris TaxID=2571273 RepID=A0A4V5NZQ4_9SPHI|nr:conjugative transposon protein TraM [Pedobacter polaris]TKC08025.1 conjugative transposon protein TraM [Pedobacter polaris]
MKINFKKPKYVLPLIFFPFFCLFFYVFNSSAKSKTKKEDVVGLQENVSEVSDDVKKKDLTNKLDAYRNQYKEADGYSAINTIGEEASQNGDYGSKYSDKEKRVLDSIDQVMKAKGNSGNIRQSRGDNYIPYTGDSPNKRAADNRLSQEDKALAQALSNLSGNKNQTLQQTSQSNSGTYRNRQAEQEKDPMDMFKKQMAYADSMAKANDPEYKAEMQRQATMAKADEIRKNQKKLDVQKADGASDVFNTLFAKKDKEFIKAIIDEDVTGYAGSRIRLRLLEDINVGTLLVKKGNYLYAEINGFSEQRVKLGITSILNGAKILPVKLDIYDLDGMPGLYVPSSAFREFSKNLGGNSMQGFNMQGNSQNQQEFLMSALDKVFQSTSTAIAGLIRKNKAKIKYNTYVYIIDSEELQKAQKNY